MPSRPGEPVGDLGREARPTLRRWLQSLRNGFVRPNVRWALNVLGHVVALGATAALFLVMNRQYFYNSIGYDEGFFVWGGWSITKGLVPYRDFIEFKPPMVFLTHALAQVLFGFQAGGYRKFFTLFPLFSVLLLQVSLVARGIGRLLAATVMLAVVPIFLASGYHDTALSDCESIGLSYYLIALALLLWEGRHQKWTTILGGLFLSCCALSKEPFAPMVIFTWAGLFWLRGAPSRASARFLLKYSLIGVAAFVVLLTAYMLPTGALKAYIAMARGYSAIYRDPQKSYCVALGFATPAPPLRALQIGWEKIRASFFNESALGYLTPLVVPSAVIALHRSKYLFAAMVLVALAGLWAPTATNCQWAHYYIMSTAAIVFILVAGADSIARLARRLDPSLRRYATGATGAVLALVIMHFGPDALVLWKTSYKRPPWEEPIPGVLAFIAKNTTPSDRIFTTGPPILYPEANRVSAVRESSIVDAILGSYDGTSDEEKLRPLYQELVRNKPKVIVLDPYLEQLRPRHMQTLVMPFITAQHYKKVGERFYVRP
jgi:hypothetical protein